jgi:glycosyltransferase involved in cell wall biosynthesis
MVIRRIVPTAEHGNRIGSLVRDSSYQSPLNIVHMVSSLNIGGMEHVVLGLATAQKRAGHHVAVLALSGGPLEGELQERGVPATVLGSARLSRIARTLWYFNTAHHHIVHAHNPTSLHYAALSKIVSRGVLVATIHGDQGTHARLGSTLEWRLTSSIVVVSHAARSGLRVPYGDEKVTVIHNGIAPANTHCAARESTRATLGAEDGVMLGVIVARIDGRKGHGTLLHSLRVLKDRGLDNLMLVIGDGADRANLEGLAAKLDLGSRRLRFLGARRDVGELLNAADFFVLPSDTEGLPISVLEAMAAGLPIVATRVGGIPELIDDGEHGLLVPPGDPKQLADAIQRVIQDPLLRATLGRSAMVRAGGEFSLAATVRNYDQLYRRVLAAKGA